MIITRENYELFFIGYLDGTLSDLQISELEDFLLINPDLRGELEGMEKTMLVPEKCVFPNKSLLYKIDTGGMIGEDNFDDYCIASVEGDLSVKQLDEFKSYLSQHPEYKNELELYKKAILKPDHSVTYTGKKELKKKDHLTKRILLYSSLSAAAAFALLILLTRTGHISEEAVVPLAAKTESPAAGVPGDQIIPITRDFTVPENSFPENRIAGTRVTSETQNVQQKQPVQADMELIPGVPDTKSHDFSILLSAVTLPPLQVEGAKPDRIERFTFNTGPGEWDKGDLNYLSLSDMAIKYINTRVFKKEDNHLDIPDITFWGIAQSGVTGINRLTGSSIRLDRQEKDKGESSVITFDAGIIGFSRTFR